MNIKGIDGIPGAGGESNLLQHVVEKGQTLQGIAEHYGINLDALLKENQHLDLKSAIQEGMTLKLPFQSSGKQFVSSLHQDVLERVTEQAKPSLAESLFDKIGYLPIPSSQGDILIERAPGQLPPGIEGLKALIDLLPPGVVPQQFMEELSNAFPEFDTDQSGQVSSQELIDAMNQGKFPPADFAGENGKKLMSMLTNLDPQLSAYVDALKQCSTKEEYAQVCKQLTGRAVELLSALYTGTGTVQDVSGTNWKDADDIMLNGVPISLIDRQNKWGPTEEWLQTVTPGDIWGPTVGE